jgi:hypothetical protein
MVPFMRNEQANPWRLTVDKWLPGAGRSGAEESEEVMGKDC